MSRPLHDDLAPVQVGAVTEPLDFEALDLSLTRTLRRGALFDSYQAQSLVLGSPLFIKASLPGLDEAAARVVQAHVHHWRHNTRLDIRGLPRALWTSSVGDQVVFAAEWIDHPSLSSRIKAENLPGGSVDFPKRLLLEGLIVLARIHEKQFIHGDIRPSNILIGPNVGEVFLVDPGPYFTPIFPDGAQFSVISRGPGYIAPEVLFNGAPMSPQADLYALGQVVHETAAHLGVDTPELAMAMYSLGPDGRPASAREALGSLGESPDGPRAKVRSPGSGAGRGAALSGSGLISALAALSRKVVGALTSYRSELDSQGRARVSPALPPLPAEAPAPIYASASYASPTAQSSPNATPSVANPARASPPSPTADEAHVAFLSAAVAKPLSTTILTVREGAVEADFSIMAPERLQPGRHFVLEVWVSPSDERDTMLEQATQGGRMVERASRKQIDLDRDALLTVLLKLPDFEVEEPVETLGWNAEIGNVSFIVKAPDRLKPGRYPGVAKLIQGKTPFASISFDLMVGAVSEVMPDGSIPIVARIERINRAFASYASGDRSEVLRRVQGIRAAGVEVFFDVVNLRAGDDWESILYREIDSADSFFLFWSRSAAQSPWVEREWRYALEHWGLDFISPLPLEDPRLVKPPPELQSKHFNDMMLAYIEAESRFSDQPPNGV